MGKRESGIQARTMEQILRTYPGSIVRTKHGTAYAVVGDPDIYGCCPHLAGKMFAFEVKNEDGTLTAIQRHRLKQFAAAGAVTAAITDPQEAVDLLHLGNWRKD